MLLKEIEVHDYRSCSNTKFQIEDEITGLIGINGSGKTNALNAIFLLNKLFNNKYRYNLSEREFDICKINIVLEHENALIRLKAKIYFETDEKNNDEVAFSELKWNFSNYEEKKWFDIPFEFFLMRNEQFRFRYARSSILNSKRNPFEIFENKDFQKKAEPSMIKAISFLKGINYYSATQFSDPSHCPVSIEVEEDKLRRKWHAGLGHEKFIFDMYGSKRENGKEYKQFISVVGKDGIGLIDDLEFDILKIPTNTYRIRSGGKIKQISRERILIVPIFSIHGKKLSPNQLSEGTLKTLALLYYILTDNSNLLLIEEPEVCIHHGLLNSIIELIITQTKSKQIVISTHSDFVLDHLTPEKILLVKYQTTKGTTIKKLGKTMTKKNYEALKDYLKNSGSLGEYWKEGGFEND